MNDKILDTLKSTLLNNIYKVSLMDVFKDEVTFYKYSNNTLNLIDKKTLSSYLENINKAVEEEYLKSYMNSVSIPKLEEAKLNGKDFITLNYKTLSNKSYTNISTLLELDNNKYVLVISISNNLDSSSNTNAKYNSLVEAISDSMIKIQNVFNLDEKSLSDTKSIENYINACFNSITSSYPEVKKSFNDTMANVTGRKNDVILIVDDDMVTRNMIKKIFNDEYSVVMKNNGKEAIDYLDENGKKGIDEASDHVIGIFLDLTMPVLDGFAVLEYLSKQNYLSRVPVIIISGDYEKETKSRVYNYNIADMLEKPFDFEVVRHRIKNFINLYKSSNSLNELINKQSSDLKDILNSYIDVYMYDYSDSIKRINSYMKILGEKYIKDNDNYNLDSSNIVKMAEASMYYDLGFYLVPRSILSKDSFSSDDISIIKKYPINGLKMVNYVVSLINDEEYKKYACNISKYYHENYDGSGYPSKLKENDIPLEAQLASICIMYNNLLKKGKENAKNIIISKSGSMFNPLIVNCFVSVLSEFEKIS